MPERPPDKPQRRKGLARHLEGWQAGALAVLLASSAVFVAVPRAVEPVELPEPLVDQGALAATMSRDDELARQAEQDELDVDIRAVGRELRTYNAAAVNGKQDVLAAARRHLVQATRRALRRNEAQLLTLRAYQMKRFLAELRHWQRTGEATEELEQLGGDFLRMAHRNRWCSGSGRELAPHERLLRVIYKKRWSDLTGANAGPFALTVDEERLRFSFFLRHPLVDHEHAPTADPLERRRRQAYQNRQRLQLIGRLAERDPAYPAHLARGVMLYRMQKFGLATEAFRRHLEASPDGLYTLRAQNYLKAALERTREGLF